MWKMKRLSFITMILVCLMIFIRCEDKDKLVRSTKLTSISYLNNNTKNSTGQIKIKYDGDRIVKVGNSTFTYLSNGKVDKEVERIVELNNPAPVTGAEDLDLTYQYLYNSSGQLVEVKLLTTVDKFSFPPAINFQPNRKFRYTNNRISEIENISIHNPELKSTCKYYYTNGLLDSVSVLYSSASANGLVPMESYDFWNSNNSQFPNPFNTKIENNREVSYSIKSSESPNPLLKVFQSLVFIPYSFYLFPFEASQVGSRIDNIEILTPSLGQELFGYTFSFQYQFDQNNILRFIHLPSQSNIMDSSIQFNYE